jgi:hypothetical protein
VELVCSPPLLGPPLYRRWGCTLPLHKAALGRQPREGEGGGDWGRWGPADPQKPNPGQPRPGVQGTPFFSFLLDGLLFEIGPLGELLSY